MTANLIDGRAHAARLRTELKTKIAAMALTPGLAMILVGDHPASIVYVQGKQKACAEVGITSHVHHLGAHTTAAELRAMIDALNDNPDIHGILLQMPLPAHLHAEEFLSRIAPHKDVDGLHPHNLGLLIAGHPHLIPCTPQGVMMLIQDICSDLGGKHAVVVGRSVLVGRPLGQLLLLANTTVTHAHSRTHDLASHTRQADILISATGTPGLITPDHVKPGAIVIDVGITRTPDGLRGDVAFDTVKNIAGFITPVPGGVGPMTIACLLKNTVHAAEQGAD